MHIPRIWQRVTSEGYDRDGNSVVAHGWGWSESSVEEAKRKALETAKRIVAWINNPTSSLDHYGYDDRLPREEIIDEYEDSSGQIHGYVSRNAYGALILNTRDLVFIDIDLPPKPKSNPMSLLSKLFGNKPLTGPEPSDVMMDEIRETAKRYRDLSFRVYRTFNGFRIMVVNQSMLPDSGLAQELLQSFRSDPLYVRMCNNQKCFRARLTPKAWRCNLRMPPTRYPFQCTSDENAYREWESQYSAGTQGFSTCHLVENLGPRVVHPQLEGLIALHDQLTRSSVADPLA